jgi:hypothetical protein
VVKKTNTTNKSKEVRMRSTACIIALLGLTVSTFSGRAQPGSILGFAGSVNGQVTVSSTSPGGCPTLVCTTNMVTYSHCFTNTYEKLLCTTNDAGVIQCTNVPVTVTRCFTNTFPQITCSNVFSGSSSLTVHEMLSGPITENISCDQMSALFTSGATFQASLSLSVRTNDWVGTYLGVFKILDGTGTNVLAFGSLNGVDGVSAAANSCGMCGHLEGTLHGVVLASGALKGARLTASYVADVTGADCSSVPQGAVTVTIQGVGVIPCQSFLVPGLPIPPISPLPGL